MAAVLPKGLQCSACVTQLSPGPARVKGWDLETRITVGRPSSIPDPFPNPTSNSPRNPANHGNNIPASSPLDLPWIAVPTPLRLKRLLSSVRTLWVQNCKPKIAPTPTNASHRGLRRFSPQILLATVSTRTTCGMREQLHCRLPHRLWLPETLL